MSKDLVLRIPNLLFKGGISLSKCYKIIDRFSEDIDLTLEENYHNQSQKKQMKNKISESCETLQLKLLNLENIRSRRDYNCSKLTNIDIPSTVTTIGLQAFKKCESIENIIIPLGVIEIGENAFDGCFNLTIKCEAESQPNTWNPNWNSTNCPVELGYTKPTYILGDLNKDDIVDTNDVIYLLMHTYFSDSYPLE